MLLINFYIYYENKKLIYNEVGIMKVTNVDELMLRLEKVRAAQKEFSKFSQEQVDEIFRQAAVAANNERIRLAKMAVEESGMGIVEDKVIKNHFAAEYIYNKYKDEKTCGVIEKVWILILKDGIIIS